MRWCERACGSFWRRPGIFPSTPKPAPAQILTALRTVVGGTRYVKPTMANHLLWGTLTPGARRPHEALSVREMEVLLRLSKGISLTRIGEELHLSVKTISTYLTRILAKRNLQSTAEIVRYVLQHDTRRGRR